MSLLTVYPTIAPRRMNCSRTLSIELEPHAALACRLIRSESIPHAYFQWLDNPKFELPPPILPQRPVGEAIDLLLPLRAGSDLAMNRQTELTSLWIASICEFLTDRRPVVFHNELISVVAAGLLPLYRTLATGRLQEGLYHSRRRLCEAMILLALIEHLGLEDLLRISVTPQISPACVLKKQIHIDLTQLDFLITTAMRGFDKANDCFQPETLTELQAYRSGTRLPSNYEVPDWADPQLLWVLSNDLISARPELILPRSWIDTPVPWDRIAEHWFHLQHLLTSRASKNQAPPIAESNVDQLPRSLFPVIQRLRSESDDLAETEDEQDISISRSLKELELIDQTIEDELMSEKSMDESLATDRQVVTKVLIGTITDLDDAALVSVIKRKIALCRSETRSICLAMIVVLPDAELEDDSLFSIRESGLSRWQQEMVTRIADQPSLKDPVAFITPQGQLIVAVLDSERSEMTTLLRRGLIEVLTGRNDCSSASLSHEHVPARFHVGLASTTAPSAKFDPQDLIESARRCLAVAQRLGKASIKSIEVF